ncbi:MAG TPA: CHRD domain-containing protein [Gemmatimonadaceae bacterium]
MSLSSTAVAPRLVLALALVGIACSSTAPARVSYTAALTGARETPSNTSSATGTATLNVDGSTLSYTVFASGFATPLVVGHIHIGGAGVAGPVIVPFTLLAASGTVTQGTVDLSRSVSYNTLSISGDSLRILMDAGQTYVNLHTAAYPGGEIRGQIVRQ